MRVAADTHVHLYPDHQAQRLFDAGYLHLGAVSSAVDVRVLCLTERAGHNAFAELAEGRRPAGIWRIESTPEQDMLRATTRGGQDLFLLAGRQIVAQERIEILALGRNVAIDDGLPAEEILSRVRDADAVPVLPWALGKWTGERAKLVQRIIDSTGPGALALADTYLLPNVLPRPSILRAAERRGFRVLAGTDPLGRSGEERIAGHYGVQIEGHWSAAAPATSMRRLLADTTAPLTTIGHRGSVWSTLMRMR